MINATRARHPSGRRRRPVRPVNNNEDIGQSHGILGSIPGMLLENVCESPWPEAILAEGEAAAFSMFQCCCSPGSAYIDRANCYEALDSSLF